MTLEVFGTYLAQTYEPPKELCAKISAKRPGWSWGAFS
jgi:sarcosine oxidase subunit delta